ncbi:hypothetical protein QJS04_geneDACA015590 [Acorus gramineus]|uniref:Uncharacterized protein n=1 Tax=Acorus gramineus TaxID=55184 RepID=A0AAV9AS11_ACOGR|nr:hypothetical protein QJS04_geneDACA015590 [Acorus gramineus]
MALQNHLKLLCPPWSRLKDENHIQAFPIPGFVSRSNKFYTRPSGLIHLPMRFPNPAHATKLPNGVVEEHQEKPPESNAIMKSKSHDSDTSDDDSKGSVFMDEEEREEMRRKIREVLDTCPDVEEETNPVERKIKMQKLLADYPLVVEDEDPDWPEDADGRGFNLDQFFNKITIKNVKKDSNNDDDGYDSDKEIVWKDDNYIRPIRDITTSEWEDMVFKDFNPLVILVHNRYRRPRENEKAREELEKAVKMFWDAGLPSPRCAAVDAIVEQDLVSALNVSIFPEVLFTKAGKILYREKVGRTTDEWSKMMAFFYYRAARPSFLHKDVLERQEKIPPI